MSDQSTPLPANPSLEQLRKRAKERLRELRNSTSPEGTLADAQFEIAREYGFESWAKLKHHIESLRPPGIKRFEELAAEIAAAYASGDERRVRAINANAGARFPTDFHDEDKVRRQLPSWYASSTRTDELALADARQMVAHAYGFADWAEFAASLTSPPAVPSRAGTFVSARPPFYTIDWNDNRLTTRGPQSSRDWDEIFATIEEHGISKLEAGGITDDAMSRLTAVECVTRLNISGSKALTDDGARRLAGMPQLMELEMGGWHTPLSDGAFESLRHLSRLREFKACWTQGLSDAGAIHLGACEQIETINVMGTLAGDGLVRALAGKSNLRFLSTGRGVTDAGIPALRAIPAFRQWGGGEVRAGLMGAGSAPNQLLIDGNFTDEGLLALEGLDGLCSLELFWHAQSFTAAGLRILRRLPQLQVFAMNGAQCGDEAMREIAGFPRLRQLQAQGAIAGEGGWRALAQLKTLECIWGRECPNFSSAGFLALAQLPALGAMGIGCGSVDDSALSRLPSFPALRQLVSIGFGDDAFRHVGRCRDLESLYCMYCRDTGDEATAHLASLEKLRVYYAGMTQITDRSLEMLSRIQSLEQLEFWQCLSLTDAGVSHLFRLPRLRKLEIHGSPKVSQNLVKRFP